MQQERVPLEPANDRLESYLESILLVAGGPVTVASLAAAVSQSPREIRSALQRISGRFAGGIRLQQSDGSAQLVSAPENVEIIHQFLGTARPPNLSRSALETIVVIAYRQPATRAEIESARGVNSDRAVQTLLARGLIDEIGPRITPGRPMQYGTSFSFLEYFGLSSLAALPPIPTEKHSSVDATSIGFRGGTE